MKILSLVPVLCLFLFPYFFSPHHLRAASPTDDYHLDSFFPLLRFIPPEELKVYENLDESRTYAHDELKIISQVSSCDSSSDCVAEFQHCSNGDCGPIESGRGTCQRPDQDAAGTCSYTQTPACTAQIGGSDYSRAVDLVYPKYQNEWQRYDYLGSSNAITSGTHNLSLSVCDRAELQLITLTQAAQTKQLVDQTGEWPLGWVDWEYTRVEGSPTLLDTWNALGSLHSVGQALTEAHDAYLLSGGKNILDVSADRAELCDHIKSNSQSASIKQLLSSPIYPPAAAKGYARCSVCVEGLCGSSLSGEGLYTDLSVRGALAAAVYNLQLTFDPSQTQSTLKTVITHNPLFPYSQIATPEALPGNIAKKLKPPVAGLPTPFTLAALGHIFDYQTLMDKFGYQLSPQGEGILGGAMPTSIGQKILNFVYGVVSLFVDLKSHLIIIPEPMAQSLFELQNPAYQTRDTTSEQEKDKYQKLATPLDSTLPLNLGSKPLGPGETLRRFGFLPCDDPDYSSPSDTIIADYATGTRKGCAESSSPVPEGKCDGALFAKLIEGSPYQETGAKGTAYFESSIKPNLTPELMNTYAAAEKETGVPCEILAGIHFVEADLNPNGSLVSGRPLGTAEPDAGGAVFNTLLDSAIHAGEELKGKVGGTLGDAQTAITALSRYNGGGNSNCQLGYPYPIPYGGCPRLFEGEDDIYPMSFLDPKHDTMYLLYCADYTACEPQVFERPGSFTVALNVYNSMTKGGYENSQLPKTQARPPSSNSFPRSGIAGSSGFTPKSCGPESLSTALGCIPYTREAFVPALLSFIVGLAGAVALLTMLIATFQIMTAGGNPEQLKKGRELFTSAIVGLLFLIFSVSLLRIVAGDIIKLPGFTN